ncbi:supervillin [Lates japonicus]|uniref:Supervillin n=1 Tax=Lates japonicus TaxID=270547 RepID=A0AAD3NDU3_LATJO|nr:supervillin [Lates japonicus]
MLPSDTDVLGFTWHRLGSETPIKLSNPRLLQKRALSFQKEFSFDEKDDPAKSTKDIDVSLLANLPKVSELRKRFEGITTSASDFEMNRKERIARRLEGIEGEVHPSLLPSLVANRLLEEDTPRYTRASDPCEPCGVPVQQYGTEGFESPDMQLMAPERQSRARCRPDPQSSIHTEPIHSSGSTTSSLELESKAERIARYKAERRRQLAERYGISLDQEPDLDHPSRYTRTRNESEGSERRNRGETLGEEGRDITLTSFTCSSATSPRPGRTAPQHSHTDPSYEMGRSRMDSFSERERLMNLENQRRAAPPEPPSSSSYMDVTSLSSAARVPARDYPVTGMPPSSPKLSRHSSLSSPKHGASPGDLFIEQQAHNILSRQGIRVRERLAREEGRQRSPELGNVTEAPVYRRQQHHTQTSTRYHTDLPVPPVPHHHTQAQLTQPGQPRGQEVVGYPSYLSMASGPTSRGGQHPQQAPEEEAEETEGVKTEGLLRSRKAVLPSEIRRRERSTEDPRRGRGEEDLELYKVQNLNQAREAETEDLARERRRGSTALGRSVSDVGDPQGPSQRTLQHQTHDPREVRQGEGFSNGESHHDTRVSVAQLRHSYMESTTTPPTSRRNELEAEVDWVLTGYEAPWRVERDRGRRPRQYIYPGESRKTSERFRTQPITSAERQETDRYCPGLKNAWLRELEKSIDGGAPKLGQECSSGQETEADTRPIQNSARVPLMPQAVTPHTAVARIPSHPGCSTVTTYGYRRGVCRPTGILTLVLLPGAGTGPWLVQRAFGEAQRLDNVTMEEKDQSKRVKSESRRSLTSAPSTAEKKMAGIPAAGSAANQVTRARGLHSMNR